jgi:hypothetical protein
VSGIVPLQPTDDDDYIMETETSEPQVVAAEVTMEGGEHRQVLQVKLRDGSKLILNHPPPPKVITYMYSALHQIHL